MPESRFLGWLVAASLSPVLGQDWPMYLKDPEHTSFTRASPSLSLANIEKLELKWARDLNGGRLAAGATVIDGVLYIGAWDGNFYALPLTEALGLEPDGFVRNATAVQPRAIPKRPEPFRPEKRRTLALSLTAVRPGGTGPRPDTPG